MNPEISVLMATYKQGKYILPAIHSIKNQWPFAPRIQMFISWVKKDRKNAGDKFYDIDLKIDKHGNSPQWEIMGQAEKQYHVERRMEWLHERYVDKPDVWRQKQASLEMVEYCLGPNDDRLVCRFDSDDVMAQGWFEKALPMAREIQARGKVPVIGPSYVMTDEHLTPIQTVKLPEFSMAKMLEGCIIPEYSITTLGPLLKAGGYFSKDYPEGVPDRYRWYALMLRVLRDNDCEVKLLPDIGFLYRQHKGQAHSRFTSKLRSKRNVEYQKIVAKHYFPERF